MRVMVEFSRNLFGGLGVLALLVGGYMFPFILADLVAQPAQACESQTAGTYDFEDNPYRLDVICAADQVYQSVTTTVIQQEPTNIEQAIIHLSPNLDKNYGDGYTSKLARLIYDNSIERDTDPFLSVSVSYVESSFNPRAKNPETPCYGLFQIHRCHIGTGSIKAVDDLYNPEINTQEGIIILKRYIDSRDGNIRNGLYRYGQDKHAVNKTLRIYEQLKRLYGE